MTTLAFSLACPSHAAEISGAEVGIGYSVLTENMSDVTKLNTYGSLDIDFSPTFGIQGDMALNHFRLNRHVHFYDGAFALHGIYHPMPGASLGGFVGRERSRGMNLDYHGLEFGQNLNQFRYQVYAWRATADKDAAIGLQWAYALNEQLSVGGRFDHYKQKIKNLDLDFLDLDFLDSDLDFNFDRIGFTTNYKLASGYSLYGELGSIHFNADPFPFSLFSISRVYIELGFRAYFGSGATFSQHNLQRMAI